MPRPYKALQKQGYKHYFTAPHGARTYCDIAIIHSKTSFRLLRANQVSPLRTAELLKKHSCTHAVAELVVLYYCSTAELSAQIQAFVANTTINAYPDLRGV